MTSTFNEILLKEIFRSKLIREAKLSSQILFAFIFVAFFSKFFFSGLQSGHGYENHGDASISIMTYSIVLFSITSIFILTLLLSNDEGKPNVNFISWKLVVIVIYLSWLISINMNHYKRINTRKVPDTFYLYSNLSTIIIGIQTFFFVITYILNDNSDSSFSNNYREIFNKFDFLNGLLIFLNFILILIQQIILDKFSVDIA